MNLLAPAQLAGPWGTGPWGSAHHALSSEATVEPPAHLSTVTVTFNPPAASAVKTNQNGVANAICASTWHWCYDSYSNMICPKDLPSSAKNAVKLAATALQPRSMSGEEEPIV